MGIAKRYMEENYCDRDKKVYGNICKYCGEEYIEKITRTTNWDGTHDKDYEVIKNCKCGKREG